MIFILCKSFAYYLTFLISYFIFNRENGFMVNVFNQFIHYLSP